MFGFIAKLTGKNSSQQKKKPDCSPVLIDPVHNVYIRPNTPEEDRISELHRQATAYKDLKDWDSAILCLQEAEELKFNVSTSYPIAHYLRLPLFLQQGGRFNDSVSVFEKLISTTEDRVLRWLPKRNHASKNMLVYADLASIYKSMSVAFSREKRKEEADKFLKLSVENKEKHQKLLQKTTKK